jgi:hypothetical protein
VDGEGASSLHNENLAGKLLGGENRHFADENCEIDSADKVIRSYQQRREGARMEPTLISQNENKELTQSAPHVLAFDLRDFRVRFVPAQSMTERHLSSLHAPR